MARMGHLSPRAALIYQHATRDRDAAIARALSDLVTGSVSEARVLPISDATAHVKPRLKPRLRMCHRCAIAADPPVSWTEPAPP